MTPRSLRCWSGWCAAKVPATAAGELLEAQADG